MVRVRFAPSPTGSLQLGNALSAVANRRFADEHGGTLLLRIDDTDPARNVEGGAEAIAADLEWLGLAWDEGPLLLSEDGSKLSKRHGAFSLADLREGGTPPEAVLAYLEELGLPKHDVHLDQKRLHRLSIDAL